MREGAVVRRATALLLALLAAAACARLSGLDELTRDDCAGGCDAAGGEAPKPPDVQRAQRDAASPRAEDGVACGAARCASRSACCLAPDGGAACDDGGGACLRGGGFLVECDDDDDCAARSAESTCCGVFGAASDRYVSTSCVLAAACSARLCTATHADCTDGSTCAAAAASAPRICR